MTAAGNKWSFNLVWLERLVFAACAVCALVAITPVAENFPSDALDPSWALGLNHAVAEGLALGRAIVFTFGPHGNVLVDMYHPGMFHMSLLGGLYLALVFIACGWLLTRTRKLEALVPLLLICALSLVAYKNTAFMSLVFFIGLAALDLGADRRKMTAAVTAGLIFVLSGLGFLFLVKNNQAVFAVLTVAVCALYFLSIGRLVPAALTVIVPAVSAVIFWGLAGQPLSALPDYAATLPLLVGGYSEAVSSNWKVWPVLVFIGLALAVLFVVWRQRRVRPLQDVLAALGLFSLYLFLTFKAHFIMEYDVRTMKAGWAIYVAALSVPVLFGGRQALRICGLLALASLLAYPPLFGPPVVPKINLLAQRFKTAARNWTAFVFDRQSLDDRYESVMAGIRENYELPRLPGDSDIYSYRQTILLASGNTWNPRPIFQSYSAYHPVLAEMNRRHLLNPATAPDNIFFAVESGGGTLESLYDGPSWPALLSLYEPVGSFRRHMILKKKEPGRPVLEPEASSSFTASPGERIALPQTNDLVYVRLNLRMGWWGRLFTALYKPERLRLTLEMDDGSSVDRLIVSGLVQSWFLISPRVTRLEHFAALHSETGTESLKKVRAITVQEPSSSFQRSLWRPDFEVDIGVLPPAGAKPDEILPQ